MKNKSLYCCMVVGIIVTILMNLPNIFCVQSNPPTTDSNLVGVWDVNDLNHDGKVDIKDFEILADNWICEEQQIEDVNDLLDTSEHEPNTIKELLPGREFDNDSQVNIKELLPGREFDNDSQVNIKTINYDGRKYILFYYSQNSERQGLAVMLLP